MRLKNLSFIYFCFSAVISFSSEYSFTQTALSPALSNPAFTGSGLTTRLNILYKDQWAQLPGSFTSTALIIDHNIENAKSGIGLTVFQNNAGQANLKSTQFHLQYAYRIQIQDKLIFSMGLNAGNVQNAFSINNFIFINDINNSAKTELTSSNISQFDLGSGVGIYGSNWWLGYSLKHLTKPNISFSGSNKIAMIHTLQGGFHHYFNINAFDKKHPCKLSPMFSSSKQSASTNILLGTYFSCDALIMGVFSKGSKKIISTSEEVLKNHTSLLIGFYEHNMIVSYSYDIEKQLGGSHEISIFYEIDSKNRRLKHQSVLSFPTL